MSIFPDSIFRFFPRQIKGLIADRRGGAGIMVGVAIVPLVTAVGVGMDAARGYMVKAKLSQALDAAGLAGAKVMTSASRNADIQMYFNANFPNGYLGATVGTPTITPDANNANLTLTVTATVPTLFMKAAGVNTMNVGARAVVNRVLRGMELVLVMDNTGSMLSNGKIGAMRTAATNLINDIYGSNETINNVWVGLVPYAASVNIGTNRSTWLGADPNNLRSVSTMTRTGSSAPYTVTVTTSTAHGYSSQDIATIAGANQSSYNGKFSITVTSSTQFTYKIYSGSAPATPATGTITANKPVAFPSTATYSTSNGAYKGCVQARPYPYEEDSAEALPATQSFLRLFWPSTYGVIYKDGNNSTVTGDNEWQSGAINETVAQGNNAKGPNLGCGPVVTSLQPSKTTALNAIASMDGWSRGGTLTNLGLAWGWRMLSPTWRGMWGGATPATMPLDYHTPLMDKVVILLTDGHNELYDWPDHPPGCSGIASPCNYTNTDYTGYGRVQEGRLGSTSASTATTNANNRTASLCALMKAQGVIIYTIVLQDNDPSIQSIFQNCASQPSYYFNSPTAGDLAAVFTAIGQNLSQLRLAQ
jgi:Flp pilus assembly protein TadG